MLRAGFAQASIPPPVGVEISGYALGPSACVLEELQAQAVAIESGNAQAVIISADVIGFSKQVVENVRTRLEYGTGILARHIVFSASHTHSGPGGLAPKVYAIHSFDKQAEPICRQQMIELLKQVFEEQRTPPQRAQRTQREEDRYLSLWSL